MNPSCLNNDEVFSYLTSLEPQIQSNFPKLVYFDFIDIFVYPANKCVRFTENLPSDGTIIKSIHNK